MPQIPRGSSLLTRTGPAGSTPGIVPGAPFGGIPVGRGAFPQSVNSLNSTTGSAYIDPLFAPIVEEQFSLFDRLGTSDLQPLQQRAFAATREEFTTQLARYLEQQGGGGTVPKPRGMEKGNFANVRLLDAQSVAQAELLGETARGAITGLRTEPVRFRAKGGLITRRRNVV